MITTNPIVLHIIFQSFWTFWTILKDGAVEFMKNIRFLEEISKIKEKKRTLHINR